MNNESKKEAPDFQVSETAPVSEKEESRVKKTAKKDIPSSEPGFIFIGAFRSIAGVFACPRWSNNASELHVFFPTNRAYNIGFTCRSI